MKVALYEPEIPQNTGTLLRTAACLGVGVDVIEPCGFVFSDKHLKRAGMDYLDLVQVVRLDNWAKFQDLRQIKEGRRLVLLTTKAAQPYTDFMFRADDVLVLGSEGAGVPEYVHSQVDARVTIAMAEGSRCLNIAIAAAMVLGEALRQTR